MTRGLNGVDIVLSKKADENLVDWVPVNYVQFVCEPQSEDTRQK